jgi:hypothetical protein
MEYTRCIIWIKQKDPFKRLKEPFCFLRDLRRIPENFIKGYPEAGEKKNLRYFVLGRH